MENGATSSSNNQKMLVDVLELIKKLQAHLDEPNPSELCKPLVQKIESNVRTLIATTDDPSAGSDSPGSGSGSPRSDTSDKPFAGREATKKRRAHELKWTKRVRVSPGLGIEDPLDDGHSWRKYGQKVILGTKHPRGYYRCTHRASQGCNAKRLVQRTDEDPSVFDVTYQGDHTCLQRPRASPVQSLELKAQGPLADPSSSSFPFQSAPPTTLGHHHSMGGLSTNFTDLGYFSFSEVSSPMAEMDFVLNSPELELDADFPFDASNFLS